MTDKDEPLKFEEALARLETIVSEMESGALDLEKMMAHFEQGSELVRQCSKTLDAMEQKIEKLVKKGDKLVAEALDPESDEKPA